MAHKTDHHKNKLKIARLGESYMRSYLLSQNWHILAQNFRCRGSEVDLIAQKGSTVIALEIKTRHHLWIQKVQPETLVPYHKRHCLQRGLFTFIDKYQPHYKTLRIDLALISYHSLHKCRLMNYWANIHTPSP